jgi:hypothetical protein
MEVPHEEKMQIADQLAKKIFDSFKGFRITKLHQKKCAINCIKIIVSTIENHVFELKNNSEINANLIEKCEYEIGIYLTCIEQIKSWDSKPKDKS